MIIIHGVDTQGGDEASITALQAACDLLLGGDSAGAAELIQARLPREHFARARRQYSPRELIALFLRDRFTDRYSGRRLVFPGTLRLLSVLFPIQFPHHPNWKVGTGHPIYWQLCPTLDHVIPTSRGGADDPSNWVTTSMVRNASKGAFSPEELGWQLHPPNPGWDGLVGFFAEFVAQAPQVLENRSVRHWHQALRRAGETGAGNLAG
jgi:hypothetical protein